VFTVGYDGRSLDELVALLRDEGVEVVVDVRQNAISRKPGFSKRRLADGLTAGGIEYRHEPTLGNPKDNREAFRRGEAGRERYRARLLDEGRAAFDDVVELARRRPIALLCLERAVDGCHRGCIAAEAQRVDPAIEVVNL
jgi:uncharacterized protein (DUF488 family)